MTTEQPAGVTWEVRRNEDGTIDEVVGSGPFHLEDMGGSWDLHLGPVHLTLYGRDEDTGDTGDGVSVQAVEVDPCPDRSPEPPPTCVECERLRGEVATLREPFDFAAQWGHRTDLVAREALRMRRRLALALRLAGEQWQRALDAEAGQEWRTTQRDEAREERDAAMADVSRLLDEVEASHLAAAEAGAAGIALSDAGVAAGDLTLGERIERLARERDAAQAAVATLHSDLARLRAERADDLAAAHDRGREAGEQTQRGEVERIAAEMVRLRSDLAAAHAALDAEMIPRATTSGDQRREWTLAERIADLVRRPGLVVHDHEAEECMDEIAGELGLDLDTPDAEIVAAVRRLVGAPKRIDGERWHLACLRAEARAEALEHAHVALARALAGARS